MLTNMSTIIIICFTLYTIVLFVVTRLSTRRGHTTDDAYFRANRKSPWLVVAYGGIGATLSGVTFMSVPGFVASSAFTYFGVVLGNLVGYVIMALILLPLYYKLNLTSIYDYLNQRFGFWTQRTGSLFFFLSRLLGSALRMYLVVYVLHEFVLKAMGIPFWVSAVVFITIILLYTFQGGIRVIIWTDTLQTTFMLAATLLTLYFLLKEVDLSFLSFIKTSSAEGYTKLLETDWRAGNFYLKQILSGIFLTIALNGLDQDMIQKNLSCRKLKDAQKNVFVLSLSLIVVNLLFLTLGAALLVYANHTGFVLPENPDSIFPAIAFNLSHVTIVLFIIGLLAAGYSSADGTLTALTTVICFDFLGFSNKEAAVKQKVSFWKFSIILFCCFVLAILIGGDIIQNALLQKILPCLFFAVLLLSIVYIISLFTQYHIPDNRKTTVRKIVHVICAFLFLCVIIVFKPFHDESLIKIVLSIAALSYGPLLGMFSFGLFTKWKINPLGEKYIPLIAVSAPSICYLLKIFSAELFNGYQFGFELLIINGLLTFIGMCFLIKQ